MSAPLYPCDAPTGGAAVWLRSADGVRLRVAQWPAGAVGRQVLILPGRTEYIEKYGQLVSDLAARGWGAVVLDWRGQGLSDRALADPVVGHVDHFDAYLRDLDALRAAFPDPMPVICHSMGGCITARALAGGWTPPAVAFSAPMWGLAASGALRLMMRGLAGAARLAGRGGAYVPTTGPMFGPQGMDFDTNPLTGDAAQFARMRAQLRDHPDLMLGGPSLDWMRAAEHAMAQLGPVEGARVLIGLAGRDRIVSTPVAAALAARWPGAQVVRYDSAEHELLMERSAIRDDFLTRALALFD